MKKLRIHLLFCTFVVANFTWSQQKWTLEQCIDYAWKNNITLKTTELSMQSERVKLRQAKNQRLPNLTASESQYINFGQSINNVGVYENKNSQQYSANLSGAVSLFSGFQIRNAISAQRFTLSASLEDLKKAKESLAMNIASAYLQVLYNKELYQVALEQVTLSEAQVTRYEDMAALGKIPAGQIYEARSQLAKDQLGATENRGNLQLSLLDLSQMLDLKDWSGFDVVQPEIDVNVLAPTEASADDVFKQAVRIKPVVKAAEYRYKSSMKNLAVTESAAYPKLSFGVNYSNGYYPGLKNSDNSDMGLFDQMNVNSRTALGFSVSIPVFNRFDTRNNVRKSKIEVEKAKLEIEDTQKTLYKEIQQAWFNAQKAAEKYKASSIAVENSEEAYRFAEEKFNNGKATLYEFSEAKMNLASAKSNLLQAKYNYLFSTKILAFYKGEDIRL